MTENIIEIGEQENYILEVSTSLETNENLELTEYDIYSLEIITDTRIILAGDLPDNIPFTKIKKNDNDGIDYYLDYYNFDGGSP